MTTIRIRNNQWSAVHCSILCIVQVPALCSKCDHLTPTATHTCIKRHFLTNFKKYTHNPPPTESLAQRTKSSENPRNVPKSTTLAHYECP